MAPARNIWLRFPFIVTWAEGLRRFQSRKECQRMPNPTPVRLLSAAALLTGSALAAAQQTPAPEPSQPSEKPPMAQKPATPPGSSEAKSAHPLLGLTAVSSDGTNIGDVRAVKTTAEGRVT